MAKWKWIPKKICEMEEFLPENLKEIQQYVKSNRKIDISMFLYAYEQRVLFPMISWSTIKNYENESISNTKQYKLKIYDAGENNIKDFFLIGWTEVRAWERGNNKKQVFYNNIPNEKLKKKTDQFFRLESIELSIKIMKKYYENFIKKSYLKTKKYFKHKDFTSDNKSLDVFVHPKLRKYYYGNRDKKVECFCTEFLPINYKMCIIKCLKSKHTHNAVIANFDSWQDYLHAMNIQFFKGENMNDELTITEQMEKFRQDAEDDNTEISQDIQYILNSIATTTRLCELKYEDQIKINNAAKSSPKIKYELRRAQKNYINLQIENYPFNIIYRFFINLKEQIIKLKEQIINEYNFLFQRFNLSLKRPAVLIPAFACLLFCFIFFFNHSKEHIDVLNQSYKIVNSKNTSFKSIEVVILPWERTQKPYAFGNSNKTGLAYRSYGIGLCKGRQALYKDVKLFQIPKKLLPELPDVESINPINWFKSKNMLFYYKFGKWCFLIQNVCEPGIDVPENFWPLQILIIKDMLSDLDKKIPLINNEDMLFANNKLLKILSILEKTKQYSKKDIRYIQNEVISLVEHFSPKYL